MLCKTGNMLRNKYYAVCSTVNLDDPRMELLNSGTFEQIRQIREVIAAEIAIDNRRPEVKAAKIAYHQHILQECESCKPN